MKILRRILLIFLLLVLALAGIGFLLPRQVKVERSLFIHSKASIVFNQVNKLRNWVKWSPWFHTDPKLKIEFSGPTFGNGSVLSWKSSDRYFVEAGTITILKSYAYDSIVLEMDFKDLGKSSGVFRFGKSEDGTRISWEIESNLGNNPVSRWFGLFIDHMVGPDLTLGLLGIREASRQVKVPGNVTIDEVFLPQRIVLSMRDTCIPVSLALKPGKMFWSVSQPIHQRKLKTEGYPLTIYHSYSPEVFDIESGIPVSSVTEETRDIACRLYPSQKTVRAKYSGYYKDISIAYEEIKKYIDDKYLEVSGPFWEVFIPGDNHGIGSSTDTTEIYFPLK